MEMPKIGLGCATVMNAGLILENTGQLGTIQRSPAGTCANRYQQVRLLW